MTQNRIISVPQMFCMLLISRVAVSMTFGPAVMRGVNFWDCIISCLGAYLVTFLLIIPVMWLCKTNGQEIITSSCGALGKIFSLIYAVYFAFVCAHTLALFKVFIENVMNPPISFMLLSLILVALTCYGAAKGIEGIARASSVIMFFIVFSLIILGFSLYKTTDPTNFGPFFYDGPHSALEGIIFFISRSSCIPAMAWLIPRTNGNVKRGIFVWNTSFYALMAASIMIVVGALGDFAQTQLFPAYSAASIAKMGSLENLDALYLGLWTASIFMKLAMFLNLSAECIRDVFGQKNIKISILIMGIILVATNATVKLSKLSSGIFSTNLLLLFTAITSIILPFLMILSKKIRKKNTLAKS
ncbi:MAG: spore germination protein [Oscillospiraceae bacterium]|jgi:spore germination protein KB|nr:spore germination protein [Oscillospiraceae bacterium]